MSSINSKAIKPYSLGDIIITSKPMAAVVYEEYKEINCDFCLKIDANLKMCKSCEQMFYCNKRCQKKDWFNAHKHECKLIKHLGQKLKIKSIRETHVTTQFAPIKRLVLRLYLMIINNKTIASKTHRLANNNTISFNDIESHTEEFENDNENMFSLLSQILEEYFEIFNIEFDPVLLRNVFFRATRFGISSDLIHAKSIKSDLNYERETLKMIEKGCKAFVSFGLYIPLTVFSHSCAPNACHVMNGNKLQMRAIKPIAVEEEITFSYISLDMNPKLERQSFLKNCFIECKCFRCETDFDENIDFDKLETLENEYFAENESSDRDFSKRLIDLEEEIIPLLKQTLGEFHPRLTTHSMNLLENKIHFSSQSNSVNFEELAELKDYVQKCIEITHGRDHEYYGDFEEIVLKLENMKNKHQN